MAGINYPGGIDTFTVPSDPENTPLSSAGSGTRDLVQSIADMGSAVSALEGLAAVKAHTHAGGSDGTQILQQAHTHGNADTDLATSSIHHTIGTGPTQAAPGTHVHDYTGSTITNKPDFICTSTTRPTDPALWTVIRETDTNCVRAWASFPNNTLTPGASYTDVFSRTSVGVTYDQTGPGNHANGVNAISTSHNLGVNANAVMAAVTVYDPLAAGHTGWNIAATCGGAPMQLLWVEDMGGSLSGYLAVYGLANIATGQGSAVGVSFNATFTSTPSTTAAISISTVSYNNVGAFGPVSHGASLIGIGLEVVVPSAPGEIVYCANAGSLGDITNPTGTQRFHSFPSNAYDALLVEDTQGATSVTIGAYNQTVGGACIGVSLIPKVSNLGTSLYSQTYVSGSNPACGSMAIPVAGAAVWQLGQNVSGRCIAVPVTGATATLSDGQDFTFTTGSAMPTILTQATSPTVDVYARRSSDGQTYVRLALNSGGATLSYTSSGPSGEISLGSVSTGTQSTTIPWEFKVTGRTFLLYRGGVQVMSINDQQNVTAMGSGYRGWAWGMSAVSGGGGVQLIPASVTSFSVNDLPIYTTQPIWQLIPGGLVPHVSAETHVGQQITVGNPVAAFFDTLFEDIFGFFGQGSIDIATTIPQTTGVTVTEPGHYDVHASIPWDPSYYGFDQATLGFTINGQDLGRTNMQFMRGNGYVPGFPQTLEVSFNQKFAAGDVLRVMASHNSDSTAWLYFNNSPAAKQAVNLQLAFTGP